jgi:hypothetical protein
MWNGTMVPDNVKQKAANIAANLLAEYASEGSAEWKHGAQFIKVEPPHGDVLVDAFGDGNTPQRIGVAGLAHEQKLSVLQGEVLFILTTTLAHKPPQQSQPEAA